jgi:acyl-CoA synthetase (AMP-forming)/AMP-acid ligase II
VVLRAAVWCAYRLYVYTTDGVALTKTWTTVTVSPELSDRYRTRGWWDGATLPALLADALNASASQPFRVHSQDRPWRGTIGDVADTARRLTGAFRKRGFGPGDPVAFQLPNSMEAAAVFYGLAMLGAVLVPIGHSSGTSELRHVLRESGARALLVGNWREPGFPFDALDRATDSLEHVVSVGHLPKPNGAISFEDFIDVTRADHVAVVDAGQPAVIGWTSGTTGSPKGVLLDHRALCAETRWHMAPMLNGLSRRLASTSPVSHVTGMLVSVLVPPLLGREVHLLDFWDPARVLDLMTAHSLSAGTGAPLFLSSLIDDPMCTQAHHALIHASSLGGAAVRPELVTRADALGIVAMRGYGCTEHPSISLGDVSHTLAHRAYSDGRLCEGVEVRVVDEGGGNVAAGEPGEVLSRGPDLFCGYTDVSLNDDAFDAGWYRTGDIGRLDDEGYLTIVDRKKDIIIRSGMNISAAEVEAALTTMPQIADIAVVAAPDPKTGEHACAFIRTAPGCAAPTVAQMREHLTRAGMAKYKWPEEIRLQVDDFPRTAAGKVRKADLRASLTQVDVPRSASATSPR